MTLPTTVDSKESPLEKLAKPVSSIIMPVSSLVNTNIGIESAMLQAVFTPLCLGIILRLLFGKPTY